MSDPLYTLEEARRELARRECGFNGHRWTIMETAKQPVQIVCDRCGKSYGIQEEE